MKVTKKNKTKTESELKKSNDEWRKIEKETRAKGKAPKPKVFKENTLYFYANQYRKNMTKEDELETFDMTAVFLAELDYMIKNGEIIIININAKMRLGKSTLGMAIGKHIFQLLKIYKYQKRNAKFGMKNVARDHQEHSKIMRDPKTQFTVIVTDESNALENTGENVTAEKALDQVFSDVQAGRYVHRVCCSPKETVDPNADILLSVTSIDKRTKTTHAKLYYRFYEGGDEFIQLLGYIRFSVADILKTWDEEAKDLFYKSKRQKFTNKDKKRLIELAQKDMYTFYYIKKYEKMDLITKEGIFKPRTLDYADTILAVVNHLRKMTKLGNVVNKNVVKNYCKTELTKAKIPFSIVGLQLSTEEAMGILDIWKAYWKITKDIVALEIKKDSGKIPVHTWKIQSDQLVKMRDELLKSAQMQENELKRYSRINEKYNSSDARTIIKDDK